MQKAINKLAQGLIRLIPPKKTDYEYLGTYYGGWPVPLALKQETLLVLSLGAGEDLSWEVDLLREANCEIFICDPTPKAVAHFNQLKCNSLGKIPCKINNGLSRHPKDPAGEVYRSLDEEELNSIKYFEFGVGSKDGLVDFYFPDSDRKVSLSSHLNQSSGSVKLQMKTIKSTTDLLPRFPNVIKMDIEGDEYPVIDGLLRIGYPKLLLCEFHVSNLVQLVSLFRAVSILRKKYFVFYRNGFDVGFIRA